MRTAQTTWVQFQGPTEYLYVPDEDVTLERGGTPVEMSTEQFARLDADPEIQVVEVKGDVIDPEAEEATPEPTTKPKADTADDPKETSK